MIKAAFFDIDGTILSHKQHAIPETTVLALQALRARGVLCFIATGRHLQEVCHVDLKGLTFDGFVTLNGQICYDGAGRMLFGQPFSPKDLPPMLTLFEQRKFAVALVNRDEMYGNFVSEAMVSTHNAVSIPLPRLREYGGEDIYQVIVYADEADTMTFFHKMPPCRLTRWNPYAIDMIPVEGGKALGIRQMLDHFGLSREEAIAFGDGDNDDEMLRFAGIGVCMGNGTDKCRAAADYITKDIEEDGLEYALRHFELI